MKEYALILRTATTGDNTASGHDCPVQFSAKVFEFSSDLSFDSILDGAALTLDINILPDEKILPCSSAYTGIFERTLNDMPISKAVTNISRLILSIGSKNIYVIGWNILEDDLKHLNAALERISMPERLSVDRMKLIDIKELASLSIAIDDVGSYDINAVMLHLLSKFSLGILQFEEFRALQWNDMYCKTFIRKMLYVLQLCMKNLDLKTLSDVIRYLNTPKLIDILGFGKHKGEHIADVFKNDNDYLCWLHSCKEVMDKNPNLKYTLDSMFAVE